jgi:predicted lipoprotein
MSCSIAHFRSVFSLAVIAFLVPFSSCTIVRNDGAKKQGEAAMGEFGASAITFDAAAFVKKEWNSKVVTEITGEAIDLKGLILSLKDNPEKARENFGKRKEETAPYAFAVKGTQIVRKVNLESAAGTIDLDVKDVSGNGAVKIQIGPVIKSSALRDVLSFLKFGDFTNQVDFANVSRELNYYVRDNIIAPIGKEKLAGEQIEFIGVFLEDPEGAVLITPIGIAAK